MNVLIVGGGIAGLSASLSLSQLGASIDLIERSDEVRALGSGITLIAPAMRALDGLGALDDCLTAGYGTSEFEMLDVAGNSLMVMPLPAPRPGLPGVMGMMRPDLHRILLEHAATRGVKARTGTTIERMVDDANLVSVDFSDGSSGKYDLVVGADGLHSSVREYVCGPVAPEFQQQTCYRVVVRRPESVTREVAFLGHERIHIGFTPIGEDLMYLYCLVPSERPERPDPANQLDLLTGYLAPFGGPAVDVAEQLVDGKEVSFVTLDTIVAPAPWNRGRVVLVGDAAHSTTPHLAAGAAMCLEDSLALADELGKSDSVVDALAAYSGRRLDRCKFVVDSSVQLSRWQTSPAPDANPNELMGHALHVLSEPF